MRWTSFLELVCCLQLAPRAIIGLLLGLIDTKLVVTSYFAQYNSTQSVASLKSGQKLTTNFILPPACLIEH